MIHGGVFHVAYNRHYYGRNEIQVTEQPWVEFGSHGLAVRIFRKERQARQHPAWGTSVIRQFSRKEATFQIRKQVFARDCYSCVKCGRALQWSTMEMHEKQPRGTILKTESGYSGGEVSVANGETRCHTCHTGPGGAHDRNPRFSMGPF